MKMKIMPMELEGRTLNLGGCDGIREEGCYKMKPGKNLMREKERKCDGMKEGEVESEVESKTRIIIEV
jgi:hypothetical protein